MDKPLKRNYILVALMLTMMLAAMDTTIVSTAIPQIVSDLGGFTKFSWVFSIYLLAQTVTIPVYGKLSDIYGRKKILLIGVFIFLLGSAASAGSWDINSLIVFRGFQGLGAGSIMATVNTIAGDIYTVKERAKIQGWLSSIWGISAVIGPAVGGALAEYVNWRWIFIINLPIGVLSIVFLILFFKEKVKPKRSKIDYKGSILILLAVGLLIVYLLEGGQIWPWFSLPSALFLGLIAFLIFFVFRVEKNAVDGILPPWIWRNRTLSSVNLAMVIMGIVMMAPETFLPTFLQGSLGLSIIVSGFILGSMSISWPTASALSGKLYLKIGFRNTALIGTIIIVISFAGFLLIPAPQSIALVVADQFLLGAGFGLLSTPTLVGIQFMVGWEQRGVVTGLNVFCRNLGQSLGAAIFGAIFNNSFNKQMEGASEALRTSAANLFQVLNSPETATSQKVFIEKVIGNATDHIYLGATGLAVFIVIAILIMPVKVKRLVISEKVE